MTARVASLLARRSADAQNVIGRDVEMWTLRGNGVGFIFEAEKANPPLLSLRDLKRLAAIGLNEAAAIAACIRIDRALFELHVTLAERTAAVADLRRDHHTAADAAVSRS